MLTPTFEPSLSPAAEHLWAWFLDLQQGRQAGWAGVLPLSWSDMSAWASMTGSLVRPIEWRILRAVDIAFIEASDELNAEREKSARDPHVHSDRPMTAELYDAIF